MKISNIMAKILMACLPFLTASSPKFPSPCYLLETENLGTAVQEKEPAGRRINDLLVHDGKIYIGTGDAVVNTGPTSVVYYDPTQDTFIAEFTVDDEAIYQYQIIDDRLAIPGVDATEEWTFGNFYVQTDTGWVKHRTIPNALHVNCLSLFNNKLYASTGAFGSIGDSIEHYFGAVFVSSDSGMTWSLSYATPSDETSVYRINALVTYDDRLFAFPYAYSGVRKENIPARYHDGLSDEPYADNYYLILRDAVFGASDVFVHDGSIWQHRDIIPEDRLCFTEKPLIFRDKLLIPTVCGEYVDYLILAHRKPEYAAMQLYTYNGRTSKKINLTYDRLIDMVTKDGTLFVLIHRDGLYYIAQTDDLKHWLYHVIPPPIETPRAIEIIDGSFYIGTQNGVLYRAVVGRRVKTRTDIVTP